MFAIVPAFLYFASGQVLEEVNWEPNEYLDGKPSRSLSATEVYAIEGVDIPSQCRWIGEGPYCREGCRGDDKAILIDRRGMPGTRYCTLGGSKKLCCEPGYPVKPDLTDAVLLSTSNVKGAPTCGSFFNNEKHCQFPFTYKSKVYYACTTDGTDSDDPYSWCYRSNKLKTWSECCPPSENPEATPDAPYVYEEEHDDDDRSDFYDIWSCEHCPTP